MKLKKKQKKKTNEDFVEKRKKPLPTLAFSVVVAVLWKYIIIRMVGRTEGRKEAVGCSNVKCHSGCMCE